FDPARVLPLAPRRCCEQRLRRDLTQDELVVAEERGRDRGDDACSIERRQLLLLYVPADLFHELVRDLPLRLDRRTELGRLHRRELVDERVGNRSSHKQQPPLGSETVSSFSRPPARRCAGCCRKLRTSDSGVFCAVCGFLRPTPLGGFCEIRQAATAGRLRLFVSVGYPTTKHRLLHSLISADRCRSRAGMGCCTRDKVRN